MQAVADIAHADPRAPADVLVLQILVILQTDQPAVAEGPEQAVMLSPFEVSAPRESVVDKLRGMLPSRSFKRQEADVGTVPEGRVGGAAGRDSFGGRGGAGGGGVARDERERSIKNEVEALAKSRADSRVLVAEENALRPSAPSSNRPWATDESPPSAFFQLRSAPAGVVEQNFIALERGRAGSSLRSSFLLPANSAPPRGVSIVDRLCRR